MTVRTRLAKLEAKKPAYEFTIPHEVACRVQACFYADFFEGFWRRAWREPFAGRLRSDRLTADDRRMIDKIPAKFRRGQVIRGNLLV